MELNEHNLEIRRKQAILKQQLAVMEVSLASTKDPMIKKTWEFNLEKTKQKIRNIDDALCRTEIITKFDLMDFE